MLLSTALKLLQLRISSSNKVTPIDCLSQVQETKLPSATESRDRINRYLNPSTKAL